MMKKTLRKKLETIARKYDPNRDFDYHSKIYAASLILENSRGPNALELGCSTGVMTKIFAQHFENLVVVDGSEYYINTVKKSLSRKNVRYHVSLFEDFETDEKFETIILAWILEHLENPIALLAKVRNWLAKKGAIHIIVPNATSLHRRIGKAMGLLKELNDFSERDKKLGHKRVYDKTLLLEHVNKANLRVERLEGILLKPFSNAQMMSWPKEVIDALFIVGSDMPPDYCNELCLKCSKEGK